LAPGYLGAKVVGEHLGFDVAGSDGGG